MRRCNNWPGKLALFIEEKRHQPFDWATNNCCFFACDWLAMLTGIDPAASFRGQVDNALSAQRIMARAGGVECVAEEASSRWRWAETTVKLARRGDVVVFDTENGPALGVCLGALAAFAGPNGVEFKPMAACRRAWRIG